MDALKVKVAASEAHTRERHRNLEELKAEVEQREKALVEEVRWEGGGECVLGSCVLQVALCEGQQVILEQCLQHEQQFQSLARRSQYQVAELSRQLTVIVSASTVYDSEPE